MSVTSCASVSGNVTPAGVPDACRPWRMYVRVPVRGRIGPVPSTVTVNASVALSPSVAVSVYGVVRVSSVGVLVIVPPAAAGSPGAVYVSPAGNAGVSV